MSRSRTRAEARVFQLKVTLRGSKPPIWRRIQVIDGTTLGELHDILQVAMGWEDCHLHQFTIDRVNYGEPSPEDFEEVIDEARTPLNHVIRGARKKFLYEYDFGDSWHHDIVVEKILPVADDGRYPVCLAGACACPPEDCGGIWGFYEKLEVIKDPTDPDHEEMVSWMGDSFDPDLFDLDAVNKRLARMARAAPA